MTEFTNDKAEALVAASPALGAEAAKELSKSTGLRAPSSFAQRLEAGLRDINSDHTVNTLPKFTVGDFTNRQATQTTGQNSDRHTISEKPPSAQVIQPKISAPHKTIQITYPTIAKESAKVQPADKKVPNEKGKGKDGDIQSRIKPADAVHLLDGIKGSRDDKERALVETKSDKRLLKKINDLRKENNLPPLKFDPRLKYAAGISSDWQKSHKKMTHYPDISGLQTPAQRISYVGRDVATGYIENASMGTSDPFPAWKASDGHLAALLNRNANLAGMSKVGNYYTFVVGKGKPVDKSKLPSSA